MKLDSVTKDSQLSLKSNLNNSPSILIKTNSIMHKFKFEIFVSNTLNPDENSEVVAQVTAQGDANIICSALSKAVASTPLVYGVRPIS